MGISNNLYNVALNLLYGCIITAVISVVYVLGILKYTKKQTIIIKELEETEINDINHKENI